MRKREAVQLLERHGFVAERRGKHLVYRNGDLYVTIHSGDRCSPAMAATVRTALRRADKLGGVSP